MRLTYLVRLCLNFTCKTPNTDLRTPMQIALDELKTAKTNRDKWLKALETATGDKVFVLNMLLDLETIQAYNAQTRIQAEQSLRASQIASYVGYILIIIAVSLGIILTVVSALIDTISVALDVYLSAIAGFNIEVHTWSFLLYV